jgi:hypothetical protein
MSSNIYAYIGLNSYNSIRALLILNNTLTNFEYLSNLVNYLFIYFGTSKVYFVAAVYELNRRNKY